MMMTHVSKTAGSSILMMLSPFKSTTCKTTTKTSINIISTLLGRRQYHHHSSSNTRVLRYDVIMYYKRYMIQSPHNISKTIRSHESLFRTSSCYRMYYSGRVSFYNLNTVNGGCGRITVASATTIIMAAFISFYYYCMSVTPKINFNTNTTTTLLEPQHLLVADSDGDDTEPTATNTNTTTTILNWSGTHSVQVRNDHYWEPETISDVEQIVQMCHERGQSVRPIGSALSPNGIGFCPWGMMSLLQLDQIIHIDTEQSTVTVQAGARVSQVIDALRPYHLTLPNLASIAEQQMGGFIQVGAHGTGKTIAPVDHYVTQLKMVTPSQGTITLTESDGELFHMAKVGLGCLGVVVEVTMKCIPAHQLREHTFVLTRQEAKEQLDTLLSNHKHMRYMWIPYTDTVVCVTNDPVEIDTSIPATESKPSNSWFRREKVTDTSTKTTETPFKNTLSKEERLQPLVDLLLQVSAEVSSSTTSEPIYTKESVGEMGFAALRDAILAMKDPLDISHVRRCNEAEAEFWKRNEDYIIKPSDELLQFDCGGQQWVWEVCFPTGTQECNNGNDILFMEKLLEGIESRNIPAHAPIEQRWSASSSSYMSPAFGSSDGLHSWVGIINYLPSGDGTSTTPEQEMLQRQDITALFTGPYCDLMRQVGQEVNATSHWAKLERPKSLWDLVDLQLFLNTRFPLDKFNAWRAQLDPKNILASPILDLLLGKPKPSE